MPAPFLATIIVQPVVSSLGFTYWMFQCLELTLVVYASKLEESLAVGLVHITHRLAEVLRQQTDLDRLRAPQEWWDRAMEQVSSKRAECCFMRVRVEWPDPSTLEPMDAATHVFQYLPPGFVYC